MGSRITFNPFTSNFDFVETLDASNIDGEQGNPGVKSINVTAPLTKSGLNTDPIIGMDLRSLSELP
jgi:hypothetical protein